MGKIQAGEALSSREAKLWDEFASNLAAQKDDETEEVEDVGPVPVDRVVRVAANGKVSYEESFSAYGERYGRSSRTIRTWVDLGKKQGDLPPLHDPVQLISWWKKWMSQKVPQSVREAAIAFQQAAPAGRLVLDSGAISDEELNGPTGDPVFLELGVDEGEAGVELKQAKALANEAFKQLKGALARGDHAEAERWRKDWGEAIKLVRVWEKDNVRIQQERGTLLSKARLQEAFVDVVGTISRAFLSELIGVVQEMSPGTPEKEARRVAIGARDRCFDGLREVMFADEIQTAAVAEV